jgi:hypothetical protein
VGAHLVLTIGNEGRCDVVHGDLHLVWPSVPRSSDCVKYMPEMYKEVPRVWVQNLPLLGVGV